MPEFLNEIRRFVTADQKDTAPVNSFEGFQGNGAIVNCSSLCGLAGGPQRGTCHAAKHGVLGTREPGCMLHSIVFAYRRPQH